MSGNTKDLDARAAAGETVVEGGTGGKSLQAQQNLAEGGFYHLVSPCGCSKKLPTLFGECGGLFCCFVIYDKCSWSFVVLFSKHAVLEVWHD